VAEYDYPGSNPTYGVVVNNSDVMRILPGGYAASVTINQAARCTLDQPPPKPKPM